MTAIDFPASPVDGQIFTASNGMRCQWKASPGIWTPAPATLGGPLVLVRETVLSSNATEIVVDGIPVTARQVELHFYAVFTSNVNGRFDFNGRQNGVNNLGASYNSQNVFGIASGNPTPGAAVNTAQTAFPTFGIITAAWGVVRFMMPQLIVGIGDFGGYDSAGTHYRRCNSYDANLGLNVNGWRLFTNQTFAAGGFMRAYCVL